MIDAPFEKIEWRVDSDPSEHNGSLTCRYVPYLDAPTVAGLLDEAVGAFNWRDEYNPVTLDGKPALACHLSLRNEGGDWVTKTDVGVASNTESQKGIVSDAFKRAATLKWGIGRNVYDLPTVFAACDLDKKGKARPNRQTQGSIREALKRAGIDVAAVGKTHESEPEPPARATSARPDGLEPASQERRASLRERLRAELSEDQRKWVRETFTQPWTDADIDTLIAKFNVFPEGEEPM